MLEGVRAVRPVGVHHGHGPRQGLPALVVVRHHHVHAQGPGVVHLLHPGDAAVHGDEESGPLLPQAADGVQAQAVAVLHPAGDVAQALRSLAAEVVLHHHRRGDAVHVVVPEDGHGLAVRDGLLDARHRPVHVLHQKGREGEFPLPLQLLGGGLRRGDAPGRQHGGQQPGVPGGAQGIHRAPVRLSDVPFPVLHERCPFPSGRKNPKLDSIPDFNILTIFSL